VSERARILVVEDDADFRAGLRKILESQGYEVDTAESVEEADIRLRVESPDVVVCDHLLTDGTALDLLPKLREHDADLPVLVLTAHGSIDLAVRAIKEGAQQFLTKPIDFAALTVVVERALANRRNQAVVNASRALAGRSSLDPFFGESDAIRKVERVARKLVDADTPILILGETGTGKGVLARWFHDQGERANEAFVDLNCAGLNREFLETELFGHEKGAFTGAASAKPGLLEVGHHGTLFLDELGDMDPQIQPKLLKVVEEKQFRRVGSVRDRRVDIRLIAATHQNLDKLVSEERFRADLYYRLNTLPIELPALRDRAEDIPLLAEKMLSVRPGSVGRALRLSGAAVDALLRYNWPGNLRELSNVLERASLLCEGEVINIGDLRLRGVASSAAADPTIDMTLEELERFHLERVLRSQDGHVATAAERLGLATSTLYQKLARYGIDARGFRNSGGE